jgi:hypothetical protein
MLWPPTTERFTMDNMVFMYAPMGRCYRHDLGDHKCGEELDETARPKLNQSWRPFGNRSVSAIARKWKAQQVSDSFIFDYHQWTAVWSDGLGQDLGATIAGDIKHLGEIGLNGMISCQCIRAFYPLPYLENAMADTLWNVKLSPRAHRQKIMSAAFGKYAEEAESYFSRLVKEVRVGPGHTHQSLLSGGEEAAPDIAALAEFTAQAQQRFVRLAEAADDCAALRAAGPHTPAPDSDVLKVSLGLLAVHAEQATRIFRARLAGLAGDRERIAAMRSEYEARLPQILRVFAQWVDPKLAEPVRNALWEAAEMAAGRGHRASARRK